MRKLVVITSVIAALVAGASASAVTRIEHIGPNSERVFTCDRNYRPLYSQRQGALRLEGTSARRWPRLAPGSATIATARWPERLRQARCDGRGRSTM